MLCNWRHESMVEIGGQVWFGIEPMIWYGLVANGLHDPAGLQRVVEEEVVVRRVLVRDCLEKKENYIFYFFCIFCNVADTGYLSWIPNPNFSIPDIKSRIRGQKDFGSRIHIK
jgi:hypothetical protein